MYIKCLAIVRLKFEISFSSDISDTCITNRAGIELVIIFTELLIIYRNQ